MIQVAGALAQGLPVVTILAASSKLTGLGHILGCCNHSISEVYATAKQTRQSPGRAGAVIVSTEDKRESDHSGLVLET